MYPPVVIIKADGDFRNLAAFKKWAVARLDAAIDESTSVRECYECGQGETCFKHGTVRLCWVTGRYTIKNNKEALTFLRDGVRKMRTSVDACIVRNYGAVGGQSLDDALLDGTVVFKSKKGSTPTDHVLSKERLRYGVAGTIEEHKGFRLLPIKGFEFLSLFAHGCSGFWYVSDLHTGRRLMMDSCPSKSAAVRAIENCLRNTSRIKVKATFDKAIKKYHGDLLTNEKEKITKTENPNKEKDMRLTKTDDKFDGPAKVAKLKKATKPKKVVGPLKSTLTKVGFEIAKPKKVVPKVAKKAALKATSKGKKRCSRCKKILPLTDFHKKTKSPDGKLGHCKICECTYQKRRRETKPDILEKPAKTVPKVTKKVVKKAAKKAAKKVAKRTAKKAVVVKKIAKKTAKKAAKKAATTKKIA
jgi:hypothetical protein